MDKKDIRLLKAETEISDLKALLFEIRLSVVLPSEIYKKMIDARDKDYNSISIIEKRHIKGKKYPGCQCYKCNN